MGGALARWVVGGPAHDMPSDLKARTWRGDRWIASPGPHCSHSFNYGQYDVFEIGDWVQFGHAEHNTGLQVGVVVQSSYPDKK